MAALATRKAALDEAKVALDRRRETNLALRDAAEKERHGFQSHRNRIVELEKQFAAKESGREQLEKSIQRSLFEKEERMQSLTTLQDELSTYQGKIDTQRALVEELITKEEKNSETIITLEESIRTAEQELANMNRQLDAKNNELKLTKNMIDNLEGFPESIKFLRKEAGWLRDAPLVSDILYCEEKFRVVIEQLLQPYLNNYIVENESFAYNALELLGKSSKGKASFFVLEYFDKEKEKTPLKIPGITPAFGVIEAEEKYRPLLSHLLDGFYIADDQVAMDKALKSGKLKGYFVLATPAGDLLRSNVQLSGGAVGLFEGKRVGRLKSLEKLDKEVKSLEEQTQHARRKVQQDRQELQQLKTGSLRNVIERERQAQQQLEKDLVSRQARIENFRDIVSRSDEYSRNTQVSLDALNTDLEKIDGELQALRTEADGRQQQTDKAEEAYRKAAELFAIEQDSWNKQHIAYIQEENLLQSKRQALGFKQRQLEDTRINLDKYNTEKDHAAKEIQRLQAQAVALGAELEKEYTERDNLMTTLSSSENEYYQQKERITAVEDQLRDRNSIIRQGEQQVTAYKDQMNDLKLRLNILKERFHIEFRIDIETIIDDLQLPDMTRQEVEDKLQRIRQRIDAFGEVNPMAEEAYTEMKERYDFISTQKKDLVEAKQDLLDTIKEIEETAREQFMETFTSVRENFIKVFRSMFNPEDSCDLVLEDPNDPLESDIDIIAKPKGKRPQSVTQLSGGEKTLTALSLLFALYLHKPAPFCILDEVDAPLDDNNIKKFNDAIRQFSDNSQFILVTHNKQTMASVDVIYGVTMVQKGMSRVVPVDFRSLN
jgi:chromosome segregation protein